MFYIGLPLTTAQKLQLVQNIAVSAVLSVPQHACITAIQKLLWLQVGFQVQFKPFMP